MMNDDHEKETWGHEGHAPEIFGEDDGDDPTAAFEALRATVEDLSADLRREMTTIRKGVEAAFDQFEKVGTPIDYRADLGNMLEQLEEMTGRVHGVETSPLLRHGPDQYAREFSRTGEAMVRSAAEQLQNESRAFRSAAQDLINQTDSARERRRQDWWLIGVGGAGIALGVFLTLFAPRLLPQTVAPRIASVVMADNAWQAGMSLLSFSDPGVVQRVADADKLVTVNKDAVADCRAAAARTAREQTCTIIVPVPETSK